MLQCRRVATKQNPKIKGETKMNENEIIKLARLGAEITKERDLAFINVEDIDENLGSGWVKMDLQTLAVSPVDICIRGQYRDFQRNFRKAVLEKIA